MEYCVLVVFSCKSCAVIPSEHCAPGFRLVHVSGRLVQVAILSIGLITFIFTEDHFKKLLNKIISSVIIMFTISRYRARKCWGLIGRVSMTIF